MDAAPYRQGQATIIPITSRASVTVRPVQVALLAADPVPAVAVGDLIVIVLATLVSYPDGPGPALPGLIRAEYALPETEESCAAIQRRLAGKEPQVRLRGMILPAEQDAEIGPVPHVVRSGDELRFTVRTLPVAEGRWPPIVLPVRYKGPRADHIYSRITDPERAFVDAVGTLKAEADGSLRVQASSVLRSMVMLMEGA